MLPPKIKLPAPQQRLLDLFRALPESEQEQLTAFAEFLGERAKRRDDGAPDESNDVLAAPRDIPRPPSESVVAAIRRLSETYPMLERGELLHEASELMTQHVMQGRVAEAVIDDLENLFRHHYDRLLSGNG